MNYSWWALIAAVLVSVLARCAGESVYAVGGTSGWDVSSDVNTWGQGRTFYPGDSLWFQFSMYESVAELTREDFNNCNTKNPIMINKSGNVTVPLTSVGEWFFASGNSMYCLSGLKLQVNVIPNPNSTASSPVAAPEAAPGLAPLPTSLDKNNPVSSSSGKLKTRLFAMEDFLQCIGFFFVCFAGSAPSL